jgi:hypothetical protein
LIFITASRVTAVNPSEDFYNSFVQSQAALNPSLPATTWHAVVSTTTISATVNAPSPFGIPVFNTGGELVPPNPVAGIYGFFHIAPILDQFGNATTPDAWTGSNPSGQTSHNPVGTFFGQVTVGRADIFNNDFSWSSEQVSQGGGFAFGIYGLSSPITVPTPEPSSLALLATAGGAAIGWLMFRRRTA